MTKKLPISLPQPHTQPHLRAPDLRAIGYSVCAASPQPLEELMRMIIIYSETGIKYSLSMIGIYRRTASAADNPCPYWKHETLCD